MLLGLEDLPQLDETMSNEEFIGTCKSIVKKILDTAIDARNKYNLDKSNDELYSDYLRCAREYYIVEKMMVAYTFQVTKEALDREPLNIQKTQKNEAN